MDTGRMWRSGRTAVTEKEIGTNPRLSLLQALVDIGRGQLDQARKAVIQVETLFQQSNDLVGMAECQLLQARISRGRGAMQESFRFLFDAEANLSESHFKLLLTIEKSVILYSAGKLKDARSVLLQCLEEYEGTGDNEAVVMILEALGNVTYLLGEPSRAITSDRSSLALNLVFLARTLSLQEKWIKARTYAKEALEVAESHPYLLRTSIPTVTGPILARTGTWDLGMELLKKAETRADTMGFVKAHAYNCQAQAALYFMQGDHERATSYTEKALYLSVKVAVLLFPAVSVPSPGSAQE